MGRREGEGEARPVSLLRGGLFCQLLNLEQERRKDIFFFFRSVRNGADDELSSEC